MGARLESPADSYGCKVVRSTSQPQRALVHPALVAGLARHSVLAWTCMIWLKSQRHTCLIQHVQAQKGIAI